MLVPWHCLRAVARINWASAVARFIGASAVALHRVPWHVFGQVPWHCYACRGTVCGYKCRGTVLRAVARPVSLVPWHCISRRGTIHLASAVALHRVPWHDLLCKCRGTALRAVARLCLPRGTSIVRRSYSRRSNSPRLWRCVPWHDYANLEGHQLSGGATPVGVLPS